MSKYDYSKVSRQALEDIAAVSIGYINGNIAHSRLQTIAKIVADQARIKTRAEYDREIGDLLRGEVNAGTIGTFCVTGLVAGQIRDLVNASRTAPEES